MIAPSATRPLAATATALVALALAGCGKDKQAGPQIPRADAAALINRLQEAERRSEPLRCNDLRKDTVPALERQLQALPDNIDADVRSTLEDGIAHLRELVDQECENAQPDTPTDTTPTTPTETQTTPAPTQTQTTPPKTTPAPTTPTPTTPAPETPGGGGTPAPDQGTGAIGPGKPKNGKDTG